MCIEIKRFPAARPSRTQKIPSQTKEMMRARRMRSLLRLITNIKSRCCMGSCAYSHFLTRSCPSVDWLVVQSRKCLRCVKRPILTSVFNWILYTTGRFPNVCPFVRPHALRGLDSALSGLKSALSGLKSEWADFRPERTDFQACIHKFS